MNEKHRKLLFEFMRYVLVGGIAFVADSGILVLFRECIFSSGSKLDLGISTAAGFVAGLIVNYILSVVFVFRRGENKNSGKSIKGFIAFAVIGVIGLGLTELGMYIGVWVFKWHYVLTKILVAGAVLVWNYVARKIIVFGKAD